MTKTTGILIAAAILAVSAAVLAVQGGSAPGPTPPDTAPPTDVPKGKPKPRSTSARRGPLSITSAMSHPYIQRGGSRKVFVELSLRSTAPKHTRRVPLNIALVIDRSGSMAGPKLAHAKEAARRLVRRLRDGDRVTLVSYGSDVTVLAESTRVSSESRASLAARIASIRENGGTFMSGGLDAARRQLAAHVGDDRVSRVILLSDGHANQGVVTADGLSAMARRIAARHVSVTTMGIGLSYNEDVMTNIAENGNGHYYFIRDSSSMASIFDKELERLETTVAARPVLRIELSDKVRHARIHGYRAQRNGSQLVVSLPDFYARQKRSLLLELDVDAAAAGALPLADARLGYRDPEGEQRTLSVAARAVVTGDASVVARHKNSHVLARAEQVAVAAEVNRAMDAYARGDREKAKRVLHRQLRRARRANRKLKSKGLGRAISQASGALHAAAEAAPSSGAGKAAVKRFKADAYMMAK